MPLELLFQCGVLLAAVLAAFAISTAVGMLVAGLWATPPRLVDSPAETRPRPLRLDSAHEVSAAGTPAQTLARGTDAVS